MPKHVRYPTPPHPLGSSHSGRGGTVCLKAATAQPQPRASAVADKGKGKCKGTDGDNRKNFNAVVMQYVATRDAGVKDLLELLAESIAHITVVIIDDPVSKSAWALRLSPQLRRG